MSPEERQILIQTHRMVEENNHLLRKMRRAALWGRMWHIFYWLVIIGTSVGTYYFVEPYIQQIQGIYGGVQEDAANIRGAASKLNDLGNLLRGE